MKQKLENYRRLEKDLIKQVNLCNNYKALVEDTLRNLQQQYKTGRIDRHTHDEQVHKFLQGKQPHHWYSLYDKHISKCQGSLQHYRQKIHELTGYLAGKRNTISRTVMLIAVLLFMGGIITYFDAPITGFFGAEKPGKVVFEDGYTVEGTRWMDIKGARIYERCLKVQTEADFTALTIVGKITSAIDKKDLTFSLYTHNTDSDEPETLAGSCKVSNYGNAWKSCTVNNVQQTKGSYWICAASPSGDEKQTQYTIAYQIGDSKKTALWTGDNWQKLDRSSYTLKAQFINNE